MRPREEAFGDATPAESAARQESHARHDSQYATATHHPWSDPCATATVSAVHRSGREDHDAREIEPGTEIGAYRVLRQLGQGAMGAVYLAEDTRLGREVALKLMLPELWLDSRAFARLKREARAMAQLSHPHVVQVFAVEQHDDLVFVTMEYVPGSDLKAWLTAQPRSRETVLEMFAQAARGLAAAHAVGLVHRDFKPANVLIGDDGRVRVADFGLARSSGEAASANSLVPHSPVALTDEEMSLTQGQTVVGTPRYMAPEQHLGHSTDARADQYAFCVALYEALTETPIFAGKDLAEQKARGPSSGQLQRLPRALRPAIAKGLAPHPDDRYPSMQALLAQLQRKPWRKLPLVAAVALAPLALWSAPTQRDCRAGAEEIAGAWSATERGRVDAALHKRAGDEEYIERMHGLLDGYVARWMHAYETVCLKAEQQPEAAYDAQMLCLKRRQQTFRAQIAGLIDGASDGEGVAAHIALEAVAALPDVERCTDPTRLGDQAEYDLQPPEAIRDDVERLRTELEDVMVDLRLRDAPRARDRVQRMLAEAEALGYLPLANRIRLMRGHTLLAMSEYDEAVEQLERTYYDASANRQPLVAIDAANTLIAILGGNVQRMTDAQMWLEHARAQLMAFPEDDDRWGTFFLAEADYLETTDSRAAAAARRERAVERFENIYPPDHLRMIQALSLLAISWTRLGKHAEARELHEHVLAQHERIFGPQHPSLYHPVQRLAGAAYYADDLEDAVLYDQRALEIRERLLGTDHWELLKDLSNLGVALKDAHRLDEAEQTLERALPLIPAALEHGLQPYVVDMRFNLASVWMLRDRLDEAESMLHRALQESPTEMVLDRLSALTALGDLERRRGNIAKAGHWYEQAWSEADQGGAETRSNPWSGLALCQWADTLASRGRVEEALTQMHRCVGIIEAAGHDSPPLLEALFLRGKLLRTIDRAAAAQDLQRVLELSRILPRDFIADAAIVLAELRGRPDQARETIEQALELVRALPPSLGQPQEQALREWLRKRA